MSIPYVWIISIAPDLNFLVLFIQHRGPTHSIIVAALVYLPYYLWFRKGQAYFGALLSHSLVGDYFTAYGCKLLWPILPIWFKGPSYLIIPNG